MSSLGRVNTRIFTTTDTDPAFILECGVQLFPVTVAYETYGTLNNAGDNAILIVHGFTADAHAAGQHVETGKLGWWDDMIGPGKAFDTDRYFVVSSNVLGGCKGSTGPASVNPATGVEYGSAFPVVTIPDMVDAQYLLLKSLGVTSLATISGASMGGMQALQWMVSYPEFVRSTIPIACSARMSAMNLAVSEISRAAIVSDPEWKDGNYYGQGFPSKGLALARMATHLTYVSSEFLEHEFGQQPWDTGDYSYRIGGEFKVQEYLRLEGEQFVERFDANSFLYLSQAMEYFDLARKAGSLVAAFSAVKSDVLLLSFSSDWLFPVPQLSEIEMALKTVGVDVRHVTVQTSLGHDAFLTDWRKVSPIVRDFLSR